MFRFANPELLYLLLLAPLLAGLYAAAVYGYRRRLARFGNPQTVARLMPDASPRRNRNKFIILLLAVVMLVLAAARPQTGSKLREEVNTGIEIMFLVDVSNSMLAQDFEPNRLERTKSAIIRLVGELSQDKVGLIVFAGDAYVQLPVTSDYVTARNFISHLSPNMVSRQGTAIGAAIGLGINSFSSQSEGSRVMVIISDGENHEDDAIGAAREAAGHGIQIYSIGIGTPEGTPIMLGNDFLRDSEGNIVVTKLDEATLEEIALTTGGAYIRATNQSIGLSEIIDRIKETEKSVFTAQIFDEYSEKYRYFLTIGLALLLLEFVLLSRRNKVLARFSLFKNSGVADDAH